MDVLDIASDGDIILIVGSEPAQVARLRVHSLFLKSVSKVFGAMFGPHFSEGKKASTTQPKEISMPEDDPEAMRTLCQVIHHNYHDMPHSLKPPKVLHVAQLADNYDCLAILKHAKTRWLDPYPELRDGGGLSWDDPITMLPNLEVIQYGLENVGCLMAVAYLFDDAGAFQELTSVLILHCVKSYLPLADERWGGSLVPSTVLYMLEEKRNLVRTEIVQTFSAPYVGGAKDNVPIITTKLREACLTPRSMLENSIMEIVSTLEDIRFSPYEMKLGQQAYYTSAGDLVQNYQLERSPQTLTKLKKITSNAGLCLNCVRSADVNMSTICRIQHQERILDDDL